MKVGIEAINFYGGSVYVDIHELFNSRELDDKRYDNLMMYKKSVGLPWEDPVTNGVNAAKPIIDALTSNEKDSIELVVTSSESGLDFGKSMSTYIHDYLELSKTCRLFEVKQACFGGTAAFDVAVSFIKSGISPGAKVLVIATDVVYSTARGTYIEPSQGIGAIAMLISSNPQIMELDFGAYGCHSYEVMDTCRPLANLETGDADLSLLSYLDCLEYSYQKYEEKVEGADFATTFDYLAFHTPFAGMVKGGHRKMMRDKYKISRMDIEEDFKKRVLPSLSLCSEVGNVYSATLYLALCGVIENSEINRSKRVGLFSYGSGCSSEFFSGVISKESKEKIAEMKISENLKQRYKLSITEYDRILDINSEWGFGVQNKEMDCDELNHIYSNYFLKKNLLVLENIHGFHRNYKWS